MRRLAIAAGHPHEHLYTFMLATSPRVGEALARRWQDDDVDEHRFRVRQTLLAPRGGGWEFGQPTSSSGRRSMPLVAPTHRRTPTRRQPALGRLRPGLPVQCGYPDFGHERVHGIAEPPSTSDLRKPGVDQLASDKADRFKRY